MRQDVLERTGSKYCLTRSRRKQGSPAGSPVQELRCLQAPTPCRFRRCCNFDLLKLSGMLLPSRPCMYDLLFISSHRLHMFYHSFIIVPYFSIIFIYVHTFLEWATALGCSERHAFPHAAAQTPKISGCCPQMSKYVQQIPTNISKKRLTKQAFTKTGSPCRYILLYVYFFLGRIQKLLPGKIRGR